MPETLDIGEAARCWGHHFIVRVGATPGDDDARMLEELRPAGVLIERLDNAAAIVDWVTARLARNTFLAFTYDDGRPAREIAAAKSNAVLGPALDLAAGELPATRTASAIHRTRELREHGILACAGTFPGLGAGRADPPLELQEFDSEPEQLRARELLPFRDFINRGGRLVRVTHAYFPRVDTLYPMSLSEIALRTMLRDQLHFQGAVVIDDLESPALGELSEKPYTVGRALAAGADLLMVGRRNRRHGDFAVELAKRVYRSFKMEKVTEEQLRASHARVLSVLGDV